MAPALYERRRSAVQVQLNTFNLPSFAPSMGCLTNARQGKGGKLIKWTGGQTALDCTATMNFDYTFRAPRAILKANPTAMDFYEQGLDYIVWAPEKWASHLLLRGEHEGNHRLICPFCKLSGGVRCEGLRGQHHRIATLTGFVLLTESGFSCQLCKAASKICSNTCNRMF